VNVRRNRFRLPEGRTRKQHPQRHLNRHQRLASCCPVFRFAARRANDILGDANPAQPLLDQGRGFVIEQSRIRESSESPYGSSLTLYIVPWPKNRAKQPANSSSTFVTPLRINRSESHSEKVSRNCDESKVIMINVHGCFVEN
jgi:hypothetical protein